MRDLNWHFKEKKQNMLLMSSYAIIIVLVTVFNLIGYQFAYHIIQSEYESVCYSKLEQSKLVFENYFTNMEVLAERMLLSETIRDISDAPTLSREEEKAYVKQAIYEMKSLNSLMGDSLYFDCFVLVKDKDLCLYATGMERLETAYYSYFRSCYSNCEAWLTDVFCARPRTYKVYPGSDSICYIRTLNKENNNVAVLVQIDVQNAKRQIKLDDEQDFSVYSVSNEEVLLGNEYNISFPKYMKDGITKLSGKDDQYVIISSENADRSRRYMYSIADSFFTQKLLWIRIWLVLSNVICILVCVVLAIAFSHRLYKPISTLVKRLGGNNQYKEPEFLFINKKLDEFISEKKLLSNKTHEQSLLLKESNLKKILLGEIAPGDPKWSIVSKLEPISGEMCVLVFDVTEIGLLKSGPEEGASTQSELSLAIFSLTNVLTELIEEFAHVSSFEINGNLVCVVNFFSGGNKGLLKERIKYTADFLHENFKMDFVCAVSESTNQMEELSGLYEQAFDIVSLCIFKEGDVILSEDELHGDIQVYVDAEENIGSLQRALNAGDLEQALSTIDVLFERGSASRNLSLSVMRMRYFEVVAMILKFLQKSGTELVNLSEIANVQIQNMGHILECVEKLEKLIRQICLDRQHNMKKLNKDERSRNIIQYIHEHYSDPYLNVSVVADVFGVSLSYISTYFKQHTGEGMANYIVKYRLANAKELLKNSDKTINEIASEIGFYNTNMFIRAFKKAEGITPGVYREGR